MEVKKKTKKPKWQRVLTKAELRHLKSIKALTKKAFVENTGYHNEWRNQAGAVEPCYTCKGIALKLGLSVSKLRPEPKSDIAHNQDYKVENTVPLMQAVELVDDNKPVKLDMPLIYWIIAISTIMTGIASAITYWEGWWW